MDLFRSGWKSVLGAQEPANEPSPSETIERLVERLESSTLFEDRRDACRALKSLAKSYRVEVGAQGMEVLIKVLEQDKEDKEMLSLALDALNFIITGSEEDAIPEDLNPSSGNPVGAETDVGYQFTDIFAKRKENVFALLDLLEEFDFKVRWPAVKLLLGLLQHRARSIQESVLFYPTGVSRLMDLLSDAREIVRNDSLLLFIHLTKGNANIQKIVAFENAFDRVLEIISNEGFSDGGVVVQDCLTILLNLLKNNASNLNFFKEGPYVQKLSPFIDLTADGDLSLQKSTNILTFLQVIRSLVSPSNPAPVISSCQKLLNQTGLLDTLSNLMLSNGIPADILSETINTVAEIIRGNQHNQEHLSKVNAPTNPPKQAIEIILLTMVTEKQALGLRCAALYCLQCFFFRNEFVQAQLVQTLLPSNPQAVNAALGQIICGGLFSQDGLSNWFVSIALSHCLVDNKAQKEQLLRVQLAIDTDNPPVTLLAQICSLLHGATKFHTRMGLLILLCHWLSYTPLAVANFLSDPINVPFLTSQVSILEADEEEILLQGVCAFLLGICIEFNDDSVSSATREDLLGLIKKRIGADTFLDKLSTVAKQESYARSSQKPQIKISAPTDVCFDFEFCRLYKSLESRLVKVVQLYACDEGSTGQMATAMSDEQHRVLDQYKELIREQDMKFNNLKEVHSELEGSHIALLAELDELRATVQQLRDQNSLLRANTIGGGDVGGGVGGVGGELASDQNQPPPPSLAQQSIAIPIPDATQEEWVAQLRARDEEINRLQMQLISYHEYYQSLAMAEAARINYNGPSNNNANPVLNEATASVAAANNTTPEVRLNETETPLRGDEQERADKRQLLLERENNELRQKVNALEEQLAQLALHSPHDNPEHLLISARNGSTLLVGEKEEEEKRLDHNDYEYVSRTMMSDPHHNHHQHQNDHLSTSPNDQLTAQLGTVTQERDKMSEELARLRTEHDDLLVLLSNQDAAIRRYQEELERNRSYTTPLPPSH